MPSFDVVNKLDMVEVTNGVDQARKEVGGRYDFKGTNTLFELDDKAKTITIRSNSEDRISAAFDVLTARMIKRNVSPKVLDAGSPEQMPGGTVKKTIKLKDGIDDVNAKLIVGLLRDNLGKLCSASINGNLVRVSSKSRDNLQEVIAFLRGQDLAVPIQFINPRD